MENKYPVYIHTMGCEYTSVTRVHVSVSWFMSLLSLSTCSSKTPSDKETAVHHARKIVGGLIACVFLLLQYLYAKKKIIDSL